MLGWLRMRMICERREAVAISRSPGCQCFHCSQMIAAAPAGHDEDALLVGEIVKFVGFQLPFQANGVQVHVADVAEFVFQAIEILAQKHVRRPAAAADQDLFSVDVELTSAGGIQFGSDFADAEFDGLRVGLLASALKCNGKFVKILRAHLVGPPEFGILDLELGILRRRENGRCGFRWASA